MEDIWKEITIEKKTRNQDTRWCRSCKKERKKERKKESRELRLAREERLREGRIRRKGEEEGESRVEKGPRRRYPSRTAG